MTKTTIYEQISDYLDGNMTDNQLKEFEIMMSDNKKLQKEVEEIKYLLQNIKKANKVKLPDNFDIKLQEAINRHESSGSKIFKLFDNPVLATFGSIAAAILLVVTVTIFFSENQTHNLINIDDNQIALEEDDIEENEIEIELHQAKTEKTQ